MRFGLVEKLKQKGSLHNWNHINNQIGMFAFTGITSQMVDELREKYHIYMTSDGRISLTGLNTRNLEYVADCFHAVTHGKSLQ